VKASEFSSLPFHHLLFTGSPDVGKTIMATASKHLTPVTLELGGKSPTILGEDFDIKTAVDRIMFSKLINSGQMCVAPDYLFIPEGKEEEFISEAKTIVAERYPTIQSIDYTCIIDDKAFKRLRQTLDDARKKGAEIVPLLPGEEADETQRKLSPSIVLNTTEKMRIMQEEIFGPYLPIKTYGKIEEVIDYINQHKRPLALYLYTNNRSLQQKVIMNTISGGVTINDCTMHVAQHDIPFGGVGNSGMGQYRAYEGFMELSKLRPVFKQSKLALSIAPPYGKTFNRIYGSVLRFKWLH
jgi:coniferyl-aldehyde dehydrogenase